MDTWEKSIQNYPLKYQEVLAAFPNWDSITDFKHKRELWNYGPGLIKKMNIPKRYEKAEAEIKKFNPDDSLYLYGSLGTGKTYFIWAYIKRMIYELTKTHTGESFPIILFAETTNLLLELRNTFNNPKLNEFDVIQKYSTADYLFLDDLGVEKGTDYVFSAVYSIINYRYVNELPTIISSNLTFQELSEKFSDRIASRVSEMCRFIEFKGRDRRI